MATITVTKGYNDPSGFISGETITPAKLNSAQSPTVAISAIQTADISDSQITTSKIADASSTTTGVTNSKLRQSAALSVIGNSTNSTAAPADIVAANDGEVMRRSGTAIGFGTVATAGIADRAVTAAKLSGVAAQNTQTGSYTLVLDDRGKVIDVNSSGAATISVPLESSVAFADGATIVVVRRGAGEVTISGVSGVTVNSEDSKARIRSRYTGAALIKTGTNTWTLLGSLKV